MNPNYRKLVDVSNQGSVRRRILQEVRLKNQVNEASEWHQTIKFHVHGQWPQLIVGTTAGISKDFNLHLYVVVWLSGMLRGERVEHSAQT